MNRIFFIIFLFFVMVLPAFSGEDLSESVSVDVNEVTEETVQEETQKTKKIRNPFKRKKLKKNTADKTQKSNKNAEQENSDRIKLVSDEMEYFPERKEIEAFGNVIISTPESEAQLFCDKIVYNQETNHIKCYGNISLVKEGHEVKGDFIDIDLNEENALVTAPVLIDPIIQVRAQKAYVYDDRIDAYNGNVKFLDSYRVDVKRGYTFLINPFASPEDIDLANDKKLSRKYRLKAKNIILDGKRLHDSVEFKNLDIYSDKVKLASYSNFIASTDKEQNYVETNMLELRSHPDTGVFAGPGWIFNTPNGTALKLAPIATFKSGNSGIGALGRFHSKRNLTEVIYSSSIDDIVLKGKHKLSDGLYLQYAKDSYLSEWFLGSRRADYQVNLVYRKDYKLSDLDMHYSHMLSGTYAKDYSSGPLPGHIDTFRFRYQGSLLKDLWEYRSDNEDYILQLKATGTTSTSLYGTGDVFSLATFGPRVNWKLKNWTSSITYQMTGYTGETPFIFDRYMYGKSTIYSIQMLKLCKYLSIAQVLSLDLLKDNWQNKMVQEQTYYLSVGPEDFKFQIGYDIYRKQAKTNFILNFDFEDASVTFDKLQLKNIKSINAKENKEKENI